MDYDRLLWKLHECVGPVVEKMSNKIIEYESHREKLHEVAEINLSSCKEMALRFKKAGLTDKETVSLVIENLTRRKVIEPWEGEVANLFSALAQNDLEVKVFLEHDRFARDDYDRLTGGKFMEKYKYRSLQKI